MVPVDDFRGGGWWGEWGPSDRALLLCCLQRVSTAELVPPLPLFLHLQGGPPYHTTLEQGFHNSSDGAYVGAGMVRKAVGGSASLAAVSALGSRWLPRGVAPSRPHLLWLFLFAPDASFPCLCAGGLAPAGLRCRDSGVFIPSEDNRLSRCRVSRLREARHSWGTDQDANVNVLTSLLSRWIRAAQSPSVTAVIASLP